MTGHLSILLQRSSNSALVLQAKAQGDILAVTPSAMDQCEELGLAYQTPDIHVPFLPFIDSCWVMDAELTSLCDALDADTAPRLAEIKPYRTIAYSLWNIFAHFRYTHELARSLRQRHQSFSLLAAPPTAKLEDSLIPTRHSWYVGACFGDGLSSTAKALGYLLPLRCIHEEPTRTSVLDNVIAPWQQARPFLGRIKRKLLSQSAPAPVHQTHFNAFVSIISYEVPALAAQLTDTRFVVIDDVVSRSDNSDLTLAAQTLPEKRVEEFLTKWTPALASPLAEYFRQLHRIQISNQDGLISSVAKAFDAYSPRFVLFPTGICSQSWAAVAAEAARRSIPVYLTQHGGLYLHRMPSCGELDYMTFGSSAVIYQGTLDAGVYSRAPSYRGGSITSWEVLQKATATSRNALYVQGNNGFSGYGGAMYSDADKYVNAVQILRAFAASGVPLTVKSHVILSDYNKAFFLALKNRIKSSRITFVHSGRVEDILHSFGLVVIEDVGSLVSTLVLGLDVPVVLHAPHLHMVRPDVIEALGERVHFSHSQEDLEHLVRLFHCGELESKASALAKDRFMFAPSGPDPLTITLAILKGQAAPGKDSLRPTSTSPNSRTP